MSSDSQAQEDEILALASIFADPDIFSTVRDAEPKRGYFSAMLKLPDNFQIKTRKLDGSGEMINLCRTVEHLPPITLYFTLPSDYPSVNPPQYTLSCQWLSLKQLNTLCKKLDSIWSENQGFEVLFLWMSFLKDEALTFLNIQSPLDVSSIENQSNQSDHQGGDLCEIQSPAAGHSLGGHTLRATSQTDSTQHGSRVVQDLRSLDSLYSILLEYDKVQCHNVFLVTLFQCGVCFAERLGSQCLKFSGCDHVYCKDCMTAYFKLQISEGNVKGLVCPSDKCQSEANPYQVKELVGAELFSRYDQLLLQTSLDTMSDIMYCPRKFCGCPVMLDQDSTSGTCPSCGFVFCRFCRLVYHGVSPCRIKADEIKKIFDQYLSASDEEKRIMEKKYGRQCIQQIIQDKYSEDWLQENSKSCPSCGSRIQKIDGCNKMTCMKCHCYFCWLCGSVLSHRNPYSHYNNPDGECFQRLFEGVNMDDDDDDNEWEFFHAA